jgi:SlyX protein
LKVSPIITILFEYANDYAALSRLRGPVSSDSMSAPAGCSSELIMGGHVCPDKPFEEVAVDESTARIIELEIRYTHQASLVEELNVELTSANARIDQLEFQVRALQDMLGSLGPELTQSPDE